MTPMELFHEARLTEALEAQRAVLARRSDDVTEQIRLAAFLAFSGRYAEALGMIPEVRDPELKAYCSEWHRLLRADSARITDDYSELELLGDSEPEPPTFLIDPPAPIRQRVGVLELRGGDDDVVWGILEKADERANAIEGHVDGRPFVGWRDADDLLAPVLEAFFLEDDRHSYKWVPLEQIARLRLRKSEDIRDLLYRPARVSLVDSSQWDLFIPVLYAGSAWHEDDGICTGAGVDWVARDELVRGLGGRTFLFGEEELTLDEFTQVETRG